MAHYRLAINTASRTDMANPSPFRGPRQHAQFTATYDSVMRTWPVAFDERNVETAYGRTHLVVSGPPSAPPLVLLHAASATSAMWRPIIAVMSTSYRCYCIDTITEANKSVATKHIYTTTDHVDWLRQTFTALNLTTARVMGMSYGGWLAAQLALHAPQHVSHLVLLTPAGTLDPLPLQWWARMLTPVLLRSPHGARRFLQWMSSTPNAPTDPCVNLIAVSMLSSRLRRVTPPSVFTDDELHRITTPVTVFIGERDVIYHRGPHAAFARAQKLIPNVCTHMLPAANHLLTLDCPDALLTPILRALA
jgi:pimeloyl-ACP methyl ester carboxylesterase